MADPDWLARSDRLEVAGIREFGEPATFTPKGGAAASIRAVFDAETSEQDPDTGIVFRSRRPVLGVRLADLPQPPDEGDEIVVRGVSYLVVDVEEDGQGGASLVLHLQ